MTVATELVIIVVLVFLNALFVAAEISLVTVRKSRIQQLESEGNQKAVRVRRVTERPQRFLAVIQVGIQFTAFLAAAFAGSSLSDEVGDLLAPLLGASANAIALIGVTLILTLFTILFGELVPKTIALAHAEAFAMLFAGPIDLMGRILSPLVRFQ